MVNTVNAGVPRPAAAATNITAPTQFIETAKKAGYSHPTPDELVEFRIMGIRHRTAGL